MLRFVSERRIMLYLLFLFLLTTSCTSKKPEGRIKAYQEAHNSGDVEKELSFLAEDIKYAVVGEWTIEGKEKLRKLVETDAEVNSHLVFTDIKVAKNNVTCKITEQNDWLKLFGIDATYYEFGQFIFEDELIKEIRTKRTQESAEELQEVRKSFLKWVSENRSQEWAELVSSGILTKENISTFLTLLRDWRKATEEKGEDEEKKEEEQKSNVSFRASEPAVKPPAK